MDGGSDNVTEYRPIPVTQGEFAGWMTWGDHDPFENQSGPFYYRIEDDGTVRCAFRAERRHMNGGMAMHGGCMLTFADFCLFIFAHRELKGTRTVTMTLNSEFAGPAFEGDLVEATGEVIRGGGSSVFVRGLMTTGGKPMLNFSGVLRKIRSK